MTDSAKFTDDLTLASQEGADLLRKPEFLDRVVTRSGMKKRDVKAALDASLAVLTEALVNGEELMLPPMGKLRVIKAKDIGDGAEALTLKLRTMKTGAGKGNSGLAEPDDAD